MKNFKFNNGDKITIARGLIYSHYSTDRIETFLENVTNTINEDDLEGLLELSSRFLEIAEKTSDFDLAFAKVNEKNSGLQNMFKILFREQIYYLENSDICGKCEERFTLEKLQQTKDLAIFCNKCSSLVNKYWH